jgi:hypothetical protein
MVLAILGSDRYPSKPTRFSNVCIVTLYCEAAMTWRHYTNEQIYDKNETQPLSWPVRCVRYRM